MASVSNNVTALIGDLFHLMTLSSTILFGVVSANYMRRDEDNFFDEAWKENGFCVTNLDVPYSNSHDMCFYVDVVSSAFLLWVYNSLKETPGLELTNQMMIAAIPGIAVHGISHGAIAAFLRSNQDNDVLQLLPAHDLMTFVLSIVFWMTMLKSSLPNYRLSEVVPVAVVIMVVQSYIPGKLQFTYIQSALLICYSVNQLSRDKEQKCFSYAIYPALVAFPLTMVGWMESTQCTAFLQDKLYGHLVYDAFIAVTLLLWYLVCYIRVSIAPKRTVKKNR
jgi:hypothetical protein